MTQVFKVGEICIGQNHIRDLYKNGLECEIIVGFGLHEWAHHDTGEAGQSMGYVVLWANGDEHVCEPKYIRKKHPPKSDDAEARQAMLDCIERARLPQGVPA